MGTNASRASRYIRRPASARILNRLEQRPKRTNETAMSDAKSPRSRVTLATVGQKAEVSIATASLILSEREDYLQQFHPATIARVRKAAQALGYRPNLFAAGMPVRKTPFFVLILHDLRDELVDTWYHWAFEGSFLAGATKAASVRRLYPVVVTIQAAGDGENARRIAGIVDGGVCGAIVRAPDTSLEKYLQSRIRNGQAIVTVFPRRLKSWPTNALDVDNLEMGRTVGRILAGRQRKTWAVIAYGQKSEPHRLRIRGLQQVAREAGARVLHITHPQDGVEAETQRRVVAALDRARPDGVFGIDAVCAGGGLAAYVRGGLKPAEDFDLIGCDSPFWQNTNLPKVTSVDVSWREVGETAVQQLADLCQSGSTRFDTRLLKPRLLPGETCPLPPDASAVTKKHGLSDHA